MEGKRTAALCCLLIVLLSGQLQQVSTSVESKFCGCYKSCYTDCRTHLPRWLCVPKCMDVCSPTAASVVVAAPTSAVDCDSICRRPQSLCGGLAATTGAGPDDVTSCVDECTNNHGTYVQSTVNLN